MMRAGGGGARLCWLLVGLLAAVPAAGHISAVCSSTSPTHPGSFTFWLATYHDNPALGSVPGQILILEPDGTTPSSAFSNWCSLQNCPTPPCASAIPGIAGESTVEEIAAEMKLAGHCQTVQDATGNFLLHADSVLACYEANVGMDPLRFGTAILSGTGTQLPGDTTRQTIHCNGAAEAGGSPSARQMKTMYGVYVDGVKPGTFQVWTDGVDDNLSPSTKSNGETPCNMKSGSPFYFDVSVADGGASCTTDPPIDPLVDQASLTPCRPTAAYSIFSGFVCSFFCQAGSTRVGTLQCSDGAWTPYKCTTAATCEAPQTGNNASIPGLNESHWISGVWDGEPGPPAAPGCGTVTEAGTVCNYTCNSDPSPFCAPTRTAPTGEVKLDFPVRWSVVCGDDGKWTPGEDFCGCRDWPCATPTLTLSQTITLSASLTESLSLSSTLSLTATETLSLTASQTQHPLCLVFDPLGSIFCDEAEIHPYWPWLLILLLLFVCFCLLLALLCRRRSHQRLPDFPEDDYPPAVVPADEISIGIKAVAPPPPEPLMTTVTVEEEIPLHPLLSDVQIGVSSVAAPPEPETIIGVQSVGGRRSPPPTYSGDSVVVGVSSPLRRLKTGNSTSSYTPASTASIVYDL